MKITKIHEDIDLFFNSQMDDLFFRVGPRARGPRFSCRAALFAGGGPGWPVLI